MTSDNSAQPISPLRARMIEDMTVRGFSEKTRHDYVRKVRAFTAFIGRSPDTATAEDLRLLQLHQTQSGMQLPSSVMNSRRFNRLICIRCPSGVSVAYRIGEDQVRGVFRRGI